MWQLPQPQQPLRQQRQQQRPYQRLQPRFLQLRLQRWLCQLQHPCQCQLRRRYLRRSWCQSRHRYLSQSLFRQWVLQVLVPTKIGQKVPKQRQWR